MLEISIYLSNFVASVITFLQEYLFKTGVNNDIELSWFAWGNFFNLQRYTEYVQVTQACEKNAV